MVAAGPGSRPSARCSGPVDGRPSERTAVHLTTSRLAALADPVHHPAVADDAEDTTITWQEPLGQS
ncbi:MULTISPECIES: hypothetical protein [unclassified Streptomyces]|uniref:hypothetical protein n=1 Tax=unclassified Streptomyces TaxID=2593676 RepID=UPI00343E13A9